jgi:Protein of unknown function (DUF3253)
MRHDDLEARLRGTLLTLLEERGRGKTIDPSEVARAVAGAHPDGWGPPMPSVRRIAVDLMKAGQIVILRKGRPVDPDDFRGVYRLARADDWDGAGNSSSV